MEKDEPETDNRIRNRNSYMGFSKVFDLVTPSQAANVKERKKTTNCYRREQSLKYHIISLQAKGLFQLNLFQSKKANYTALRLIIIIIYNIP